MVKCKDPNTRGPTLKTKTKSGVAEYLIPPITKTSCYSSDNHSTSTRESGNVHHASCFRHLCIQGDVKWRKFKEILPSSSLLRTKTLIRVFLGCSTYKRRTVTVDKRRRMKRLRMILHDQLTSSSHAFPAPLEIRKSRLFLNYGRAEFSRSYIHQTNNMKLEKKN